MTESKLGPVMGDVQGLSLSAVERDWLQHPLIGGLILFSRNFADRSQLRALIADIRELRPDILLAADTEGGRVQRFRDGFCVLPAARRYGSAFDTRPQEALERAEAGGRILAAELAALDIDLPFSPVLDLDWGVSGVIGDRAWHSSSRGVAALCEAHMRGLKQGGVATTGKHFPGHGGVAPDSHAELPRDERDLKSLLAEDLAPYVACLPWLDSVMAAHVVYPQVDALPASFSARWLREILGEQLGFRGVVFADDLSMGGARGLGDIVARAEAAFTAGCDMLPICNTPLDLHKLLDEWRCREPLRGASALAGLRRSGKVPALRARDYAVLREAGLIETES